ncbi:hypothetical protein JYU20_00395 [Bacteroidales bacterium AH-315-I05]|nr:hypothetical protein [Bacteroidales bacterium AH-315-I05]
MENTNHIKNPHVEETGKNTFTISLLTMEHLYLIQNGLKRIRDEARKNYAIAKTEREMAADPYAKEMRDTNVKFQEQRAAKADKLVMAISNGLEITTEEEEIIDKIEALA